MAAPYSSSDLTLISSPLEWAQCNPQHFFDPALPIVISLHDAVWEGVTSLGLAKVEKVTFEDWYVVGAAKDWFALGRFPIPESLEFSSIPAFPEQGDNCHRPEFSVAAFARDIVVFDGSKINVTKGSIGIDDSFREFLLGQSSWLRALAFR
jgi:hypothetical protein